MPRSRPGGMRSGTPGTAYPNRADLARQPSLPARVATGQTYGKAQSELQAQAMVPMAAPSVPAVPAAPAAPGAGSPSPPAPGGGIPPGPPPVPPGGFGDLHRASERPGEPVTAGAPVGAGAGPEAIPPGPSSPQNTNLSQLLAQIAQASGSAAVAALARHAASAGQ